MVSSNLRIENNTAVDNRGQSGYGILVKDIEDTTISGNELADNDRGLTVSNSQDIRLASNLLLENDVGVHSLAGSADMTVVGNSFVRNDVQAFTTRESVVAWNGSDAGNYWSDARTVDLGNDGVSETRHRPAGTVERLLQDRPETAAFAESPAFTAVRLAEDSFPVLESPGIVDHHPLTESPHNWTRYYRSDP
jgi:nitrous oxidase accessory protein